MNFDQTAMKKLLTASKVNQKEVIVLFDYQNKIVKFIVKQIKYRNNDSLKKRIANYLYEEIINFIDDEALFADPNIMLIPIPMSPQEKRKRGFNQCEELCKEISKINKNLIRFSTGALKKIRETKRQTSLGRTARFLNVKNSMLAERTVVSGKIVFVLDDVYTTGATMNEARRALLLAGAKKIINIFIAH
jgi:ComF family protein